MSTTEVPGQEQRKTQITNTYLTGNWAPVMEEHDLSLEAVRGRIPADLDGAFLRVGPNPVHVYNPEKYHVFDGDGMVHMVEFAGGRAGYRNRFIQTECLHLEQKAGKAIWQGMDTLNNIATAEVKHGRMNKNPGNTSMIWNGGKLLALYEGAQPHALRLPSLETIGEETFAGELGEFAYSAHPKVDPVSGDMIACSYSLVAAPHCQVTVVNREGKMIHKTAVDLPKGVIIHDCAITKDYTLILDLPLTFDLERGLAGQSAIEFEPTNGSRIGIMKRMDSGDKVRWFDVKTASIFHTANAWQEGDEIVMEACRLETTSMLQPDARTEADKADQGALYQYRFNLATGDVKEAPIDPVFCDFTRINESYIGVKNRYIYSSKFTSRSLDFHFDGIIQFDREQNSKKIYSPGPGCHVGEAVFAPRTGSTAENDGYVVVFVRDETRQKSECHILDARDFDSGPVAVLEIPVRVPNGFHSHWVAGDMIRAAGCTLH